MLGISEFLIPETFLKTFLEKTNESSREKKSLDVVCLYSFGYNKILLYPYAGGE